MISAYICIGVCCLGLLACEIVLLVDTAIQNHKWKKEQSKR
jgi:hypothetical protein